MSDQRARRLAAILMADIVGFSKMMGRDDEGTAARVVRFHSEVETLTVSHGGRVVDTAGDSVFAVFESIVLALECASAIQQWLAKDDGEDRIMVRIGLHFGDVLVHDTSLFGDGVNIAARLEQLAPAGGIAASDVVYQEVGSRIPFKDAGLHTLKNIARPIRVYVVPPEHFGFSPTPVGSVPDTGASATVEGADAVREIAALIKERVAEKRLGHSPTGPVEEELEAIAERTGRKAAKKRLTVRDVMASGDFWFSLAAGSLLVASHPSGWTSNGIYPVLGALLVATAVGSLLRGATGRRGMRSLTMAVALGLSGWLFLDGTVSRAIVWVLAAAALGPAIAGMRRSA
jgi:Adenylate and Guanylate cyclase catalytic domain